MIYIVLISFFSVYMLWVFYLAVMSLKRAKDAGILTRTAAVFGYPVLYIGLLLDMLVNVLVMTLVLLEWPRELLVTSRLQRHNRYDTGWRKNFASWAAPLLDPFDPSGEHI